MMVDLRERGSKVEPMDRRFKVESGAWRPEVKPGDGAGDREAQGRSEQLDRATEGGAKGLKGASGGGPRN